MSKMRKALSWLLALVMVLSLVPMSVFAAPKDLFNDSEFHIMNMEEVKTFVRTAVNAGSNAKVKIHGMNVYGTTVLDKEGRATGAITDNAKWHALGDFGSAANGVMTLYDGWKVLNDAAVLNLDKPITAVEVFAKVNGEKHVVKAYLTEEDYKISEVGGTLVTEIYLKNASPIPPTEKCTLTYNANGGQDAPEAQTVRKGEQVTLSTAKPTHEDVNETPVIFVGWTTKDNKVPDILDKNSSAPATVSSPLTLSKDTTIYAAWAYDTDNDGTPDYNEGKYTVTYTDGVENEEVFADQEYEGLINGEATPAFDGGTPQRDGYVFDDWNPEVTATVTKTITYVAQWDEDFNNDGIADKNQVHVIYSVDKSKGTVVGDTEQWLDQKAEGPIQLGAPVVTGMEGLYEFTGWACDDATVEAQDGYYTLAGYTLGKTYTLTAEFKDISEPKNVVVNIRFVDVDKPAGEDFVSGGDYTFTEGMHSYQELVNLVPEGYTMTAAGQFKAYDGAKVTVGVKKISTTGIMNIRFVEQSTGTFISGGDYTLPLGVQNYNILTQYVPEGYQMCVSGDFTVVAGTSLDVPVEKISTTGIMNIRFVEQSTGKFIAGGDYFLPEGVQNYNILLPYVPDGYQMCVSGDFMVTDGGKLNVPVEKISTTGIMNIRFVEQSTGKFISGGDYTLPLGVQNYNILNKYVPDGYQMCVAGDFMVTDGGKLDVPVKKTASDSKYIVRFFIANENGGSYRVNGRYVKAVNLVAEYDEDLGTYVVQFPTLKVNKDYELTGWKVSGRYTAIWHEDSSEVRGVEGLVNANNYLTITPIFAYTGDNDDNDHPTVETRYTIEATAHKGGEISPDGIYKVYKYSDKTYTITADKGYKIYDVVVDGVSVGAVHTYTFERVTEDHTIEVYFAKLPTDPDDSGTSNWLETKDHVAYMTGYPDGTFGPNRNMTRAEVAQMFYALLLNKNVTTTVAFSDVSADAWYAKAVNTLASLGMVSGYPDGTFHPDAPITRAEFATIALAFAYEPLTASCNYNDVPTSAWFYTYVAQATTYGWIGGSNGYFRPNDNITRAEVSVIVNNMLGRAADEDYVDAHAGDLVTFPDVRSSFWAYYSIMETVNDHEYVKLNGLEDWK